MSKPNEVIWGLPGTGKTTTLMNRLSTELELVDDLGDVVGTTFRKSMAREFQNRAKETLGLDELPEYHNFRTTHAICYRLTGASSENIVKASQLREFFRDVYSYSAEYDLSPRRVDTEGLEWSDLRQSGNAVGNVLVQLYDWSRHIQEPIEKCWKSSPSLELEDRRKLSPGMVVTFQEEYEDWKRDNGLTDFTDMLVETLARELTPGMEVLIEDEFQDKSPLMKKIYDLWKDDAERTYVSGDAFQALYGYMGGRPELFEVEKDRAMDSIVLDKSYRFGEELWDDAVKILERENYEVPEIEPTGSTRIKRISYSRFSEIAKKHWKDEVAYLVRTNYIGRKIADILKDTGIPVWTSMSHRWTNKNVASYNSVVKMRSGFPESGMTDLKPINLQLDEANRFVDMFPSSEGEPFNMNKTDIRKELNDEVYPDGYVDMREYINPADIAPTVMKDNPFVYMNKSVIDVDKLSKAWDLVGEKFIDTSRHVLTTIHGFKGDEADYVFLFNSTSSVIQGKMHDEEVRKDEARVWFVGATRAKKVLYVVDVPTQYKYNILP